MNVLRRKILKITAYMAGLPMLGFSMDLPGKNLLVNYCVSRKDPESIHELYPTICSLFNVGRSTDHALTVSGEMYEEFAWYVVDFPGAERNLCSAVWGKIMAQVAYWKYVRHVEPDRLTIFWRIMPEFVVYEDFDSKGQIARIYLRYRISDKPDLLLSDDELLRNYYNRAAYPELEVKKLK